MWNEISPESVELKFYWNRIDSLHVIDSVLYRKWESEDGRSENNMLVVPKSMIKDVIFELHNTLTAGHLGVKRTLNRAKHRFYWYNMKNTVRKRCQECDLCGSRRAPSRKAKSAMKQYNVGAPLERVGIDVMGPFPRSNKGHKYILVIADYFTKCLWIIPLGIRRLIL